MVGPALQAARRIERWSGLLGVAIGIVALIVGVALGVWSVNRSDEIARRSGSFDHPKVTLYLGNWPLTPDETETFFVGAAFNPNSVTLLKLPLRLVNNSSNRTAEDVTVMITFPSFIRAGLTEFGKRQIIRTDPGLQFTEERNRVGHFELQSYNFPRLNPENVIGLDELIGVSKETALTVPVPDANLTVDVTYGYTVDIHVDQKNETPQRYRLVLSAVKATTGESLHRSVEQQISKRRNQVRESASFREYLALLIARRTDVAYVAFAPPAKATATEYGTLVEAALLSRSVSRVDYPQATWRRLLN